MMVIQNKYSLGEILYLKTDSEQKTWMVTEICILPCGVMYKMSSGIVNCNCYEMELTTERNVLITTTS